VSSNSSAEQSQRLIRASAARGCRRTPAAAVAASDSSVTGIPATGPGYAPASGWSGPWRFRR
jgi:hypothetical protein